jgi:hypothetical protein
MLTDAPAAAKGALILMDKGLRARIRHRVVADNTR